MVLRENKASKILGVFFVILGFVLLVFIIPWQIAYVDGGYPQPRFFPDIIAGLMVVLGICLFVSGFVKEKKKKTADEEEEEEVYSLGFKEGKLVLLSLAACIVYVIALYYMYYVPATMIFLAVLIVLYGQRSIVKIILPSVILPLIIYVGFTYGLQLKLP